MTPTEQREARGERASPGKKKLLETPKRLETVTRFSTEEEEKEGKQSPPDAED